MTVTKKLIGRLPILIGEYDSAKVYSKRQRVTLYGSEFESKVDNNSIAPATLNNGNLTINTDNWRVVSNGSEAFLAGEKLDKFSIQDNPELIDAKIDTDGKLISYRDDSGKLHENAGIITKTIEAETIEYTQSNLSDLQIALKKSGYNFSQTNWSDYISKDGDNPLCLPIPSRGYLNVITYNSTYDRLGLIDNQEAQVEYWDMLGNYFKKAALISQQGNSTKMHYKRNFTIDFFDSDIGGDAFSIKFGDWPAQDSYNVKAYYNDIIKGVSIIAYKLYNDIDKTYGVLEDRPYKEYWTPSGNNATSDSSDISRNTSCDARTISDGFPIIVYLNGEFYGVFAFSLKKHRDNYQLDRNKTDNIHLDGTLGSSFWSGNIIWSDFEIRNPKPKSTKWNFLTQNNGSYSEGAEPMGKDSAFYNADNISCVNSAKVKDNIIALSKYMSELKAFSDAYEADKTDANLNIFKTEFEKRFGLKWLIDYIIIITVAMNGDSLAKNWQWVTWGKKDGIMKWYVRPWDMDGIFGENSTDGFAITPAYWFNYIFGNESNLPTYYVIKYYLDSINARYKELRDLDVISYRHFTQVIENWTKCIGEDNFKHEYEEKWTESPCFRNNNISEDWNYDGNINPRSYITWNDDASNYNSSATYSKGSWCKYDHKMFESVTDNNTGHLPTETNYWKQVSYKEGDTFKVGDYVWDGYSNFFKFFANKDTSSKPLTKVYDHYPREGGNFDSMLRICSFVKDRIAVADEIFKYNN